MYLIASLLEEHFAPVERLGDRELQQHALKAKSNVLSVAQHESSVGLAGFRRALAETHYDLDHRELHGLLKLVFRKFPDAAESEAQRGKVGGVLRAVLIDYYSKKAAGVRPGADLRSSRELREIASRALETYLGADEDAEARAVAEFKKTFGSRAVPALKRIIAADDELEGHAKKFRGAKLRNDFGVHAEIVSERLNNVRTPFRFFAVESLRELEK